MSRTGEGQIRVLHVDDEPDFADLVATYLERTHDRITVETATSARDGLDRLSDDTYDCVVSDHDMPGMDGLELLKRVRETDPDLPFVLFTGKGSEEIASDAISAGVTEYLQKGTGTEQYAVLANRVERAVEEYRAKSALEESERMLSTLISNLPGMAYRCRNERGWPMEFVSDGCRDLTGYDPESLVEGDVVWGEDVLLADERDQLWERVQAAIDEREPFEVTYRIETADGEIRWAWEQGRGVFQDGDLVALEGIILDITDRKSDEMALEGLRARYDGLIETVPDPVVVIGGDGTVARAGSDAAALFGASREALVGRDASDLFAEDVLEAYPGLADPAGGETADGDLPPAGTPVETAAGTTVRAYADRLTAGGSTVVQVALREDHRPAEADAVRSLVDRIDDGVVALDDDYRVTYVNEQAASLFGEAPADLLGADFCSRVVDEDGTLETHLEAAVETGEAVRFETEYEALGRWFDVSLYPAADGLSIYARDVTERHEREAQLERYRTLVENVGDAMYVLAPDGTIEMANEAMADHLGYDREEIVGSHASRFMPEDDVRTGEATIRELLTSDRTWGTFEMETIHADGSTTTNEDKIAVLTDEEGAFVGSVGVLRDISERTEREQELRRYETIIQAVGDPVYALDPEGYFTFVNDAAREVSGYDPDELIGEHVSTMLSADDWQRSTEAVRELLEDDEKSYVTFEVDIVDTDGSTIPAENHLALLPGEDGPPGTAGVIRDITERKLREKRLEEFASVVSHDLQSPLNVVAGRAELALETGDLDHVEDVLDAVDRMEDLIEDLLTLAREGRVVGEPEPTSLEGVADDAWAGVETGEATCTVETDLTVEADRDRLRALLANLFRNAVEHGATDGDGPVAVTVGALADDRGFYVADDGPGIPEERREAVFEHGHTTSDEGSGLGLKIVENIVEAHGWSISVTESAAGGARFEVLTG